MDRYGKLYAQLVGLIPDLLTMQPGDHRKSEAPGCMDLHLDILARTDQELHISLAHNYEHNGDMIPDPDMEIRIYLIPGWEKAEALTFQDAHHHAQVYPDPGYVRTGLKRSLNAFLKQWLTNLKLQGHTLTGAMAQLKDIEAQP